MLSPHPPCQAIYQAFIILDRVQNRRMTNTPNQSTSLTIAMNQHRFPNPTLLFHVQKVVYRSKNCGCIIFWQISRLVWMDKTIFTDRSANLCLLDKKFRLKPPVRVQVPTNWGNLRLELFCRNKFPPIVWTRPTRKGQSETMGNNVVIQGNLILSRTCLRMREEYLQN